MNYSPEFARTLVNKRLLSCCFNCIKNLQTPGKNMLNAEETSFKMLSVNSASLSFSLSDAQCSYKKNYFCSMLHMHINSTKLYNTCLPLKINTGHYTSITVTCVTQLFKSYLRNRNSRLNMVYYHMCKETMYKNIYCSY